MATYEVEKDGQVFEIDVPEGVDPQTAISEFVGESVDRDRTLGEFAGDVGESAARGAGLATRAVAGFPARATASLADLAASALNLTPALWSRVSTSLGGPPIESRVPTGHREELERRFTQIGLPEAETFPERVADLASEFALPGATSGMALAQRIPQVAQRASRIPVLTETGAQATRPSRLNRVLPAALERPPVSVTQPAATLPTKQVAPTGGLADEIAKTFAQSPRIASGAEISGSTLAAGASELAEEVDASPAQQALATTVAGLAGTVAPQALISTSRKTATKLGDFVDNVLTGETRAARRLQEAAADPKAAARAAAEAPEGVLPARATEDPGLRTIESRVLADDPKLAAQTAEDLVAAERRALDDLAEQFGPGTDKAEWQQQVIQHGAPEGATIKAGHPDEMLNDAYDAFGAAYEGAKGFPVSTQNVQVEGGNIPLKQMFSDAATDSSIIADKKWRRGIQRFLNGLVDDVNRKGKPVGPADANVAEVDSAVLLEMRSKIRTEARRRAKSGVTNARAAAEADMLNGANRAVTKTLESQLPPEASAALKATDAQYREFQTVQGAVLRSGDEGLTPKALKASLRARETAGDVARGRTGELGALAETGRDAAATLGKPDQAARLTRNMTPEQLQTAKADFNRAISDKSLRKIGGEKRLSGQEYLDQIKANRETLKAAGFTGEDINRMETVGKQLKMVQSLSPKATKKLVDDELGRIMNVFAALAGSKAGSNVLNMFGGAGSGGSLILTRMGSQNMRDMLKNLTVDKADLVLRGVATNKELYAALLVKPTDPIKRQADAARVINAWLAEPGQQLVEPEKEE